MSYSSFTAKELKPEGWLRNQLEIQARGLSGSLDKIWPDVRDSAWIGGNREGWERVPYWLDGFIPLAYLLDDADMKQRAKKYIDAILSHQYPDGWICPCTPEQIPTYDTWAVQLISKVLTVYYDCTGDERIPGVVYAVMRNYYDLLKTEKIHLFGWGKYRWFEAFIALGFLRDRYEDAWITELADILYAQGHHYEQNIDAWKRPLNQWTYETHVVNLAMMLKTEAVTARFFPERERGKAEALYSVLMRYNGTPVDIFTGDECLSGLSPIQGTELCAVAELAYSFELLYAATGDSIWAERLEKVVFNALPATLSDDMWAHQYVQMSNQIAAVTFPGKSIFRTNNSEAHLFGLEPNYGCCTANFNQAWPKFALNAFLVNREENTVLSAVPVPSCLRTEDYTVRLETDYPFKNALRYHVTTKKSMTLAVRIPSFACNLRADGKAVDSVSPLRFPLEAGTERDILITFDTPAEIVSRPHGLHTVMCGSLVYSLPIPYEKRAIEYRRDGVERKVPYCDYEYIGKSEWRYGLCGGDIVREECDISPVPFSSDTPPVKLHVRVKPIRWEYEDGYETVAAKVPADPTPVGEEREIAFYPYGCAKLRVTELPLCDKNSRLAADGQATV